MSSQETCDSESQPEEWGMHNSIFESRYRLNFARVLVLLEFIAILVSTSLAVVIEVLLYLTVFSSKDLLRRLYAIRNEPMIRMTLVWVVVLAASCLYTIAPSADLIDILPAWRKILILPIAAACFDAPVWKNRAIHIFFITIAILLIISSLTWLLGLDFYKYRGGIIIANHASQGMSFSVCIILALALADMYKNQPIRRMGYFIIAAIAFLNIVFITPGRSGYLAMAVIIAAYVFFSISGIKKYFIAPALVLTVVLALGLSPTARKRIDLAVSEMKSYQTSDQFTSMGVRMVVWQNSLKLIREKPIIGYGTAAFVEAYKGAIAGQSGWQGQVIKDPHNQFLRILVEHGIVGFLIFLLFIGSFFLQPTQDVFRCLGLSVLLTWCATSLFSSHFTTFFEGRFLLTWLGVFLAGSGRTPVPTRDPQELSPSP